MRIIPQLKGCLLRASLDLRASQISLVARRHSTVLKPAPASLLHPNIIHHKNTRMRNNSYNTVPPYEDWVIIIHDNSFIRFNRSCKPQCNPRSHVLIRYELRLPPRIQNFLHRLLR